MNGERNWTVGWMHGKEMAVKGINVVLLISDLVSSLANACGSLALQHCVSKRCFDHFVEETAL